MKNYHCDLAIQYWAAQIGKSFQTIALLSFMWNCAGDPWAEEPRVFLAASRLDWLIPERTTRAKAIAKLVKVGAIRKSPATRSGCAYTLVKPVASDLALHLQDQLDSVSPRDYRHPNRAKPKSEVQSQAADQRKRTKDQAGPPTVHGVTRAQITDYLNEIEMPWPKLGRAVEALCGLAKNSVLYKAGSKEVEALGAWALTNGLDRSEFVALIKQARASENKPGAAALRYVFEADTDEKRNFLAHVLAQVRQPIAS